MFAIDHAATALLVKRKYPAVSMAALLVSVQAMEILWVAFNYAGLEQTTTEAEVRTVAGIHLAYMPFSHSVVAALTLAVLAWWIVAKGLKKPLVAWAVAIAILSHLVLDLVTHAPDIALAPGVERPKLGLGLYSRAPLVAFGVELVYGMVCWYVYRGSRALLAVLVLFNVANLSLFSAAIPGPEVFLAGKPLWIVTVIAAQILVTLLVVGMLSRPRRRARA